MNLKISNKKGLGKRIGLLGLLMTTSLEVYATPDSKECTSIAPEKIIPHLQKTLAASKERVIYKSATLKKTFDISNITVEQLDRSTNSPNEALSKPYNYKLDAQFLGGHLCQYTLTGKEADTIKLKVSFYANDLTGEEETKSNEQKILEQFKLELAKGSTASDLLSQRVAKIMGFQGVPEFPMIIEKKFQKKLGEIIEDYEKKPEITNGVIYFMPPSRVTFLS